MEVCSCMHHYTRNFLDDYRSALGTNVYRVFVYREHACAIISKYFKTHLQAVIVTKGVRA